MNGIDGRREAYKCPSCRKSFFFWRPDALPGVKVKCYYCGAEFEDEASKRAPVAAATPPPPPAAPKPEAPPASPATSP